MVQHFGVSSVWGKLEMAGIDSAEPRNSRLPLRFLGHATNTLPGTVRNRHRSMVRLGCELQVAFFLVSWISSSFRFILLCVYSLLPFVLPGLRCCFTPITQPLHCHRTLQTAYRSFPHKLHLVPFLRVEALNLNIMSGLHLLRRGSRLSATSIRLTRTLSTTHQEQALQKLNQNPKKSSAAPPPPPPTGPSSSSTSPNGSSSSVSRKAALGIAAAGLFAGGLLLGKEVLGSGKVVEYSQENKFRTPKYASVQEMQKVSSHLCLFPN